MYLRGAIDVAQYSKAGNQIQIDRGDGETALAADCSHSTVDSYISTAVVRSWMAGLPARPDQHVDGESFTALLKGEKELARKAIYWHNPVTSASPTSSSPAGSCSRSCARLDTRGLDARLSVAEQGVIYEELGADQQAELTQ